MSILTEYEQIRKEVGEEVWNSYNWFLVKNESYLLSDLLYNDTVFKRYEEWIKQNPVPHNFVEQTCDKISKYIAENNNLLNDSNEVISELQRVEDKKGSKVRFEREDEL